MEWGPIPIDALGDFPLLVNANSYKTCHHHFLHNHFHIYHETILPVFNVVQDPFFICQISFVTFRWLAYRIKLALSAIRLLSRCRIQVVMSGTVQSLLQSVM